jgi:hypothetical protein
MYSIRVTNISGALRNSDLNGRCEYLVAYRRAEYRAHSRIRAAMCMILQFITLQPICCFITSNTTPWRPASTNNRPKVDPSTIVIVSEHMRRISANSRSRMSEYRGGSIPSRSTSMHRCAMHPGGRRCREHFMPESADSESRKRLFRAITESVRVCKSPL